ncbi:MAG TPA: SLC13 family permease [Humisphaera sp.]
MTGTTLHLVAFAALAVAVAWGSATAVNAGLVALVAAFAVGSLAAGLPVKVVVGLFPADLFLVLVGATLLFAIVRITGTIDVLAGWAGRAAAGRRWLVPVLMFLLAATMATAGAFTPAAVAIVAPVAMELATRHRIHRLAMGLAVVEGANAGAFSPANPFGAIAGEILRQAGEADGTVAVYANSFAFNAGLALVGFVAVQWWFGSPAATPPTTDGLTGAPSRPDDRGAEARLTPFRAVTLAGLLAVLVLTLGFRVDVGVAGLAVALGLVALRPALQKPALEHVPWPAILLVTGIVTYVGVLGRIGSIAYLEGQMARLGAGAAAALVTAYLVAVVSAFASTVGTLGAAGPIVTSLAGSAALSPVGVVSAIGISAAAVDLSPMSTSGALLMASADRGQERAFFRALLVWAALIVLLVPPLAWLAFVVL